MNIKIFAKKLKVRLGGSGQPIRNHDCDYFETDNFVLSRFVIERLIPIVGYEPFPINELILMSAALCRVSPTHVFEWGTNVGKSARIFYEVSAYFGLNVQIHSIDLPDDIAHAEHPGSRRGEMVKGMPNVSLHQGDGVEKALQLARSMQGNPRFLFFLDGDHSQDSVSREIGRIENEFPFSSVLLHDTFFQSSASGYNVGPFLAIQSIAEKGWIAPTQLIRTDSGLPGMTLLYRAVPSSP